MPKHEQLYIGPDGWSRWLWPLMRQIRMTCCHCGLVHDIEVTVHKVKDESRDGMRFKAQDQPARGYRIKWRFRENRRATGQVRRHMRKKKEVAA